MGLKEYRKKLIGNEDERAVSPVIGVILMVAITVILAAVIAAFIMDIGPSGDTTPNSQIQIDSDSTWNLSEGEEVFASLDHGGGDAVAYDDIIVHVEVEAGNTAGNGGNAEADATLDSNNGFSDDGVVLTGAEPGDEFSVGNSLDFETEDASSALDGSSEFEDGSAEVTIIHEPSNGILLDTTIDIADWNE